MLNIRSRRLARIKPANDAQATHLAEYILDHARRRYEKYRDGLDAAEAYGINLQAAFPRSGELVRELDFAISYCHRRLNELDYCLALSRT